MEKMIKKILFLVLFLPCLVGAYHEFKVPKKAYRKVTIEYYSNEKEKTSPDSTVYIYYDKYDVEIYRVVKKGCGSDTTNINCWGWHINVWDIADSTINGDYNSIGDSLLGDSLFGVDDVWIKDLIDSLEGQIIIWDYWE